MPMYTFYPNLPDGTQATFEIVELDDDSMAAERAVAVLKEHQSCSHVVVWCGDRRVATREREGAAPSA